MIDQFKKSFSGDFNADAVRTFIQWLRHRRDYGVDIRLCALEPVHKLLARQSDVGKALMPSLTRAKIRLGGGLIHIAIVVAVILLVFNLVTGRGARV